MQPATSLHDQSQVEKRSKKKEEWKRVSWWSVGSTSSRMETQEEKRLFFFKWRQQEQSCTVSSIDCREPPGEERLNGWVRGWDRGLLCRLGVGVKTPLRSGSSFWAGGAGCRLGCSFSGQGERGREGTHHWSCTETWRGHRVMPHTHMHTQGWTHNHYLKGFANLPDSQPVWQPVMQFQTFVMTG